MSTTHFQIAYLLVGFSGTLLSNSFFSSRVLARRPQHSSAARLITGRLFLFYQPVARKRGQLPELFAWTERRLVGRPHVGPPSPGFANT